MSTDLWLKHGENPEALLKALDVPKGRVNPRKLLLYAVACCRSVPKLHDNELCRGAVEISERYAEGYPDIETLDRIQRAAFEATLMADELAGYYLEDGNDRISRDNQGHYLASCSAWAALQLAKLTREKYKPSFMVQHVCDMVVEFACCAAVEPEQWGTREGELVEATMRNDQSNKHHHLLHDSFDGVVRTVGGDPDWLTPTVISLSRSVYENRAFGYLPILIDALEEAGCTDAAILDHCRGPGPHVRGCWVLDLLLGKQ